MKSYANSLQRFSGCSGKIDTCKGAVEFLSYSSDHFNIILSMHDDRHWLSEMSQINSVVIVLSMYWSLQRC